MIHRFFPSLNWLLHYKKTDLRGDVTAGVTVTIMLVPQAMALALLAGLPPIVGLYTSVVPILIYALFGSSRQLAVGPVALVSLLVASGVSHLAEPGSAQFIAYATLLAGLVGILQVSMGLLNFGFLVNFLSHPVISGFTSAAAVIIALSQFRYILGVNIPRSAYFHQTIYRLGQSLPGLNWPSLLLGAGSIGLLIGARRWFPKLPPHLVVVGLAMTIVWAFDLHLLGLRIMGQVPEGLHGFELPHLTWDGAALLLPLAVAITLVGYMESMAVAKSFAARLGQTIDANQELIALGLANVGASLFGGYPVTGGFARTAVNAQAGAHTALASIITSVLVALTLLFLTDFFYYIPDAALAAIIVVAISRLIDFHEPRYLWRVKRTDFISWAVTFVATLGLGIENGLLVSIATSLVLVVRRTTRPHYAILGRLPGTKVYRNVSRYPEAITLNGLIVIRIDASLYFANVSFLLEKIDELVRTYPNKLNGIVFDASSVNDIDTSADRALHRIADNLAAQGIRLYFTKVKGPVRDVFRRSGLYNKLGEEHFFFSNHDAVKFFLDEKTKVHNEIQSTGYEPGLPM